MSEKPVASIKTLARYEPEAVYIGTGEYVAECVRADDGDYYLAADVDAVIEALQTEIEALRSEVDVLREQLRLATVGQATAEAEANDVRRNDGVHVPGAGQPAAPDVEAMVEALRGWWEARRPVGWTEDQHRSCPHVNLATNAEKALATAMLRYQEE